MAIRCHVAFCFEQRFVRTRIAAGRNVVKKSSYLPLLVSGHAAVLAQKIPATPVRLMLPPARLIPANGPHRGFMKITQRHVPAKTRLASSLVKRACGGWVQQLKGFIQTIDLYEN